MGLRIPEKIESVEFWKYVPRLLERTKPKKIKEKNFVSAVQQKLTSKLEELEFYAEAPYSASARYILKLHFHSKKSLVIKVNGNVIVTKKECYLAQNKSLWTLLESKVNKTKEKISPQQRDCKLQIT